MASLIKNQILKHLSKFAKNLSHDQIHLSTLKGEGELTNLELNEEVLTELLELPSWLRLSVATCNRVTVRIQWTKLKTVPIYLFLDEVRVEVETCEDLRQTAGPQNKSVSALAGSHVYGFSDKVVDGISLSVNSVILTLRSHAFVASIQLSRISVDSKTPTWQKADLRMTRVKDTDRGELLIFKELSWQTVRIEAKSTKNEDLTPLRLITNQARCRITIKKRLSDCAVLGCRLVLILDDLLWVLTDDQLKAALHFADSLSGLLVRATEETQKIKGARKLESLSVNTNAKDIGKKQQKTPASCAAAKVFARYDVIETSYHLYSDRIDLHLCDDPGGRGRSCHPKLSEGGAFQVSLSQLQVDFYPYHLASGDRSAWIRYQESIHSAWLENSLNSFQTSLLDTLVTAARNPHTPLTRANVAGPATAATSGQPLPRASGSGPNSNGDANNPIRSVLMQQLGKLMTTNLVVRLNNFSMWKVSTSKAKATPKEFLAGDRRRYSLPDDMNVIHFEYTQFYYPGDMEFPLPPPKLFAYFNPIQLSLDPLTVLWLNAFALNLQRSVKLLSPETTDPPYLDVKVEAIMFRVQIEASEEEKHSASLRQQIDRPDALNFQASRIVASNYRSHETGSKADLAKCLNAFQDSELFFGTDFPNLENDIPVVCDKMVHHATGADDIRSGLNLQLPSTSPSDWWPVMKKDLLWIDSKDVWYVHVDPLWADFEGTPATEGRAVAFVDAFPITMWMYKEETDTVKPPQQQQKQLTTAASQQQPATAKMHLLIQVTSLVSVQLNHYQFLFLMRMLETISEITTFLTQDVSHILGEEDESSMALGLIAPQVDVSLLLPFILSPTSNPTVNLSNDDLDENLLTVDSLSLNIDNNSLPTVDSLGISTGNNSLRASPSVPQRSLTPKVPLDHIPHPVQHHEAVSSAPPSPTKLSTAATTMTTAESLPNQISGQQQPPQLPPRQFQQPTRPMMTPPAIHLPMTVPSPTSSEGLRQPRSRTFKPSLASSLSNMMAQLDSSFRPTSSTSGFPTDDNSDSLSVMSDDSDTSDSYVVINASTDAIGGRETIDTTLFAVHSSRASPVEVGMEVTEDSSPVGSMRSVAASSTGVDGGSSAQMNLSAQQRREQHKKDEIISVTTFHLGRIEMAQQSIGRQACIKVQAASLSGEECPQITWEEFQAKFASRGKGWSDTTLQPPSAWCFKLRFNTAAPDYEEMMRNATLETTSMSLKEKISRSAEAFLQLKAQNLPLQFYTSTLNGLADLFEDEVIPTPIPMKIELENLALHLVEDRPSANATSPGSLPIDVAIPALTIVREKSGLFCIQPSDNTSRGQSTAHASFPEVYRTSGYSSGGRPHLDLVRTSGSSVASSVTSSIESELQQRASILAVDNSGLRSQLESANVELMNLRSRVRELESTRAKLVKVQQQALALDKENKSMKQTLKYLQEELLKSGKRVVHNN